ncbi:MAG: transcription antitermination factor NusB, partial [Hydrogenovibrio sp.]|nr:transcription antitermination factor NusB [Hydrogenovibrio sp.]
MSKTPANAPINPRFIALKICLSVIEHGRSLSQALQEGLAQFQDRRERAFTQNLVLGTLRWQDRLEAIRAQLLKKPLKAKDEDINQLILLGLYQILYMDTP